MSENRRSVLSNLATIMGTVTGVVTVARSTMPIDILNYKEAELPLLNIVEPEEDTWTDSTSQRAVMVLEVSLQVWFVHWGEDPLASPNTYQSIMKAIRDKIGANFTLNNSASGVWVIKVSKIAGEFPVYSYGIDLRLKYYLDQQRT